MKHPSLITRLSSLAATALLAAAVAGCAYVDPAAGNPGRKGDYTRAETISSAARLRDKLLASEGFKRKYQAKRAEKTDGGVPVIQIAYFKRDDPGVRLATDEFLRQDLAEALFDSGWFTISGDLDACDFVLHGTYRRFPEPDGSRVSHRVIVEIKDIRTGELVWTGSDEIAKR